MAKKKKVNPRNSMLFSGRKLLIGGIFAVLVLLTLVVYSIWGAGVQLDLDALLHPGKIRETEEVTQGIDVAKYQGIIDWEQVAASDIDFAMIRVGFRRMADGEIREDPHARYNLQEAAKYEVPIGVYFFSTAITAEEAQQEASWVADYICQYPITYPVAYNCEGYQEPDNRQYALTVTQRTDMALAFLAAIAQNGYEPMFYASKNEMEGDILWEVSRIQDQYKVWVAQYPEIPYPQTESSSYSGTHHMWQYTSQGTIPGISGPVDLDVAYFGYSGIKSPISADLPEPVGPNVEGDMVFETVSETVTAKDETNLRDRPSQDPNSVICHRLQNGQLATRIGVSESGWSKVKYNGKIYYAFSNYLTTNLNYDPVLGDVGMAFTEVSESVTAKNAVNLRTLPSTDDPDCEIIVKIKNGTVVTRTGINEETGWSRVEYEGQTLYCVSKYLQPA